MLKIENRGKQERSSAFMSFSKSFYFSIVFAALYLSSNSVLAQTGEGVAKQKAVRRGQGREGLKTGKNMRTSFIDVLGLR